MAEATIPPAAPDVVPPVAPVVVPPVVPVLAEKQTAIGEQPQGESKKDGQGEPAKAKPIELKLPEGVTLDEKLFTEYKALAEQFDPQKGLEFLVSMRDQTLSNLQEQVAQQVEKQKGDWLTAARADKELGGAAWDDTLTAARTAVSRLGGDSLREVLNKTGLGNHPEIIRAFARAGKALSEDVIGGRGAAAPLTAENAELKLLKTMYPTMFPQTKE